METTRERDLADMINNLRDEARFVKECFTKFSFQAIAFASAAIGAIIKFQFGGDNELPIIGIVGVTVVYLLVSVARIGNYKYGAAHRLGGYELHLDRTKELELRHDISDKSSAENLLRVDKWYPYMRHVGWEEAMRAWRIVHSTVFGAVYKTEDNNSQGKIKRAMRRIFFLTPKPIESRIIGFSETRQEWFTPDSLIVTGSRYYVGSYLKTMMAILHIMAFICMAPLVLTIWQYYQKNEDVRFIASAIFFVWCANALIHKVRRNVVRSQILEQGLLSIHSNAILWQAIILAHYRALQRTLVGTNNNYNGYTNALSHQALIISNNLFLIHDWIENPDKYEPQDGLSRAAKPTPPSGDTPGYPA